MSVRKSKCPHGVERAVCNTWVLILIIIVILIASVGLAAAIRITITSKIKIRNPVHGKSVPDVSL